MNPRQRRGLLLMIIAGLGAIVVFISVIGYVGNVRDQAAAEVGQMTTVLRIQSAVTAFQPITPDAVQRVQVPKKWASNAFITDLTEVQGKVAASNLQPGAYLQQGMLVDAPTLRPGQREIAIMVDAEAGVAGTVQPGSIVDVYSSFDATNGNVGGQGNPACAVRILSRVQVISIGQLAQQQDAKQPNTSNPVVPVTFALDPTETLRLTYAESFAKKVRLALVGGSNDAQAPDNKLCQTPVAGK